MARLTSSETASTIIYTQTDEAPQLAAASLLPIFRHFASAAGIEVEERDISLAGRVIAVFPERLQPDQVIQDELAELGKLVTKPDANVIKLPNISASLAQLMRVIEELQSQGYNLPDYPEKPETDEKRDIKARYDAVKGSAVNPVLREGNSDRRAPAAVKAHAKVHPHKNAAWSKDSKTRVLTMSSGDFRSNEISVTLSAEQACGPLQIVHVSRFGDETTLAENLSYPTGAIIDASFMSKAALIDFYNDAINKTAADGTMFSLHLKATMMKVSDPIIFGHALRTYLAPVFDKHGAAMAAAGIDPNAGLGVLLSALDGLDNGAEIKADIEATLQTRPPLYMVNSDRGITNFHVPSDVIIDASMPAVLKAGGKGWGPDGNPGDTACVIPDSSYAAVYGSSVDFFKTSGALDPATSGTVQNVGLMAKKAEEYGSHPTTFELSASGTVSVRTASGDTLLSHQVEAGDIWRMASTRPEAIENWVDLALSRARITGYDTVFWLDQTRGHDAEIIKAIEPLLAAADNGKACDILAPGPATTRALQTISKGGNCIAATGNVLRDYLTDLFPILEVGTSAKMLSVVRLMNGGGLFETGAGGSAPKHVEQLVEENHLRWDSLGEFCAIAESLRFEGEAKGNARAKILGDTADQAITTLLQENKSPGRKVGQPDCRDSHFYFALYWAKALAEQTDDPALAESFATLAAGLAAKEADINSEMHEARGNPCDLGGYFRTDATRVEAIMRPSASLNALING